jgi:hypothetical protein
MASAATRWLGFSWLLDDHRLGRTRKKYTPVESGPLANLVGPRCKRLAYYRDCKIKPHAERRSRQCGRLATVLILLWGVSEEQ